MGIDPVTLIAALIVASTPILLAAIGELVVEKAGVLNLGVEGMMIVGAICGFAIAVNTGSPTLGFVAAAVGGAVLSLIFAFITQYLLANQVATGLALTLFGLGLSALLGESYSGINPPPTPSLNIPGLSDMPVLGPILFAHDAIVYLSIVIVAGVWAMLKFSRMGLIIRAVGESHDAAHALGYKVIRIRVLAIMFGGACAGLGGAYLSLVRVPQWTEGMTAGAGWIALAIVVFASWKPWRALLGAYLFGGITALQLRLQAAGIDIPVEILAMSPYLITILVLVIMSSDKIRAAAPGLCLQLLGAGRSAGGAAGAGAAATAMGHDPGLAPDPAGAAVETGAQFAGAGPDGPRHAVGSGRVDGSGRDGRDGALCRRGGYLYIRKPGAAGGVFLDPEIAVVGGGLLDHRGLWRHGSADSWRTHFHDAGALRGPRHRGGPGGDHHNGAARIRTGRGGPGIS